VTHTFATTQWVEAPVERVFRFFCDPRNLAVISPPSSGARLMRLALVPPDEQVDGRGRIAGAGSEIVLSVRLLPYLPVRASWTARIMEFEWLRGFRDSQVKGPFKKFEHTHSFTAETRNGREGTLIGDHVEYEVGFGPVGEVANAIAVQRVLRRMFESRHRATQEQVAG
jgi:ligand-binding SRPBCC domain-containing protein